jgi:NarL family two-component system response regulator YdfI
LIRVIIAAASGVVRAGLEALLRSGRNIEVAGATSDTADLASLVERLQPDVVLVDLDHEADWPAELASPAVLLTGDPHTSSVLEALRAGARAVLPRDLSAAEMTAALEAVAAGLVVLHPRDLHELAGGVPSNHRASAGPAAEPLSGREIEVLRMLAEGVGNKTIAWKLGISEHTVKFHVASIMSKLNAGSRTEAVTMGIRQGLIML